MSKNEKEQKAKKAAQKKGAVILGLGLVFVFVSFYAYQMLFTDNLLVDKEDKALLIPTGAKFKQVVDSLEQGDYLHDRLSFMFLSRLLSYRDNIKSGRYMITRNMNNFNLFKKLKGGHQDPLKLTIINFRTKEEIIRKFSKRLEIDSARFAKDLNDNNLLKEYGFNDTTIISLFIPNSYDVYWTADTKEILNVFYREYNKFWNDERMENAKAIGMTPIQIITMASIIEAETQKNDEKPKIAGVYMNRYNAGQRLQADPTLIFATKDFTAKRVNEFHRYFKSPFNTYRRKGLPPGPINTPSVASIDAVLSYERHEFFFFCANPDLSGYHLFSRNFDEHLGVAQNYWKSLDKENIH
jgi:UPF0755 protein